MAQYLVAIHLPDDFDPSAQVKAMEHDYRRAQRGDGG